MAMTKCLECFRDISDKAAACPGCGAPVVAGAETPTAPSEVSCDSTHFFGTTALLSNLARSAISQLGYRVDAVDQASGTITFTTGVTMGSWSGVSGTIHMVEVAPYKFHVSGQAKQNVKGGQVVALDLFGEAQGKVDAVVNRMKGIAQGESATQESGLSEDAFINPDQADSSVLWFLAIVGALTLVVYSAFTASN
jgi:hypothetical protein